MIPNMLGFKKTAVTGHTRHLGYEREQWGSNGSPGYGVCIHIMMFLGKQDDTFIDSNNIKQMYSQTPMIE